MVLRAIEQKIEALFEGVFGRAFRTNVQPVELARKLAKEMDDHKTVSVSRVYVPNEYTVYLSPEDRERFASFEHELVDELAGYLLEHARRERFALMSKPAIAFDTDEQLRLGEFGIQARLVHAAAEPAAASQGDVGHTMIYSAADRLQEPLEERARQRDARALLVTDGKRLVVGAGGATIGRSRSCDVVLADANVSREHAEIRPRGGGWTIADLGSTNGIAVNGARVERAQALKPGDRIEIGTTVLTFELE
jgi:hypothetical protein